MSNWPNNLSKEQLISELKQRIELIKDLRRHRDSLLETINTLQMKNKPTYQRDTRKSFTARLTANSPVVYIKEHGFTDLQGEQHPPGFYYEDPDRTIIKQSLRFLVGPFETKQQAEDALDRHKINVDEENAFLDNINTLMSWMRTYPYRPTYMEAIKDQNGKIDRENPGWYFYDSGSGKYRGPFKTIIEARTTQPIVSNPSTPKKQNSNQNKQIKTIEWDKTKKCNVFVIIFNDKNVYHFPTGFKDALEKHQSPGYYHLKSKQLDFKNVLLIGPFATQEEAYQYDEFNPENSNQNENSTIDFIEDKQLNYNLGNAVEHIVKGNNILLTSSLEKAKYYIDREIKRRNKQDT